MAHCEQRGEVRRYELARMESVKATRTTYEIPASFSLEEALGEHGVFNSSDEERMIVWYSERIARWIAERYERELDADGTLTMEHPLADIGWAVRHVLQYGPEAVVVSPVSVRTAVREAMERLVGT